MELLRRIVKKKNGEKKERETPRDSHNNKCFSVYFPYINFDILNKTFDKKNFFLI